MNTHRLTWLFVVAFLFSVHVAYAGFRPLYLYTRANKTAYLIKHDENTPFPMQWNGERVTSFRYYAAASPDTYYNASEFEAERFVVDPSFSDYQWTTTAHLFSAYSKVSRIEGLEYIKVNEVTTATNGMFAQCKSLSAVDVSGWEVRNVTNMNAMFYNCESLSSLDVSNWDTGNVTDMGRLFLSCSGLSSLDVSAWNTSKVTTMERLFLGCSGLSSLDVSAWDTRNVTNMEAVFMSCDNLTSLDVSAWNTANVTNMSYVFSYCKKLPSLDVSNWDTGNVIYMGSLFSNCHKLSSLDISRWDISNVIRTRDMFHYCVSLTSIDLSRWNTSKLIDVGAMFSTCLTLSSIDLSTWNTDNLTLTDRMFNDCHNLSSVNLSTWNTSKVTDMSFMFSYCYRLPELDISTWNMESVTNMDYMFHYCHMLKRLYLNNIDGRLLSINSFMTHTHNLEYLDMSRSKHLPQSFVAEIRELLPNRFTLIYLPQGSNVTGPNVITHDGVGFKCAEYVVSDDTLMRYTDDNLTLNENSTTQMKWEVNIPHSFTADKVTNTRTIGAKAGSAYTWFMPYSAPIPAGVEVYEFKETTVDGIVATFVRSNDTELKAQKPYLVKSTAGEVSTSVNATSEVPAYTPGNDVVAAETSDGWKFIGSFQWRTTEKAAEEGLHTLQTGNKWKHYEGSTAKPRPFRAYLKKAGSGARELSVNFEDGSGITGIEKIELLDGSTPENNSIYDLNGRYLGTRRDVLPTGTYIIGGKATRI